MNTKRSWAGFRYYLVRGMFTADCLKSFFQRLNAGVNKKPFVWYNPTRLEFNSDETVLKIFSFDRQKLGWQRVAEQTDCPFRYRF